MLVAERRRRAEQAIAKAIATQAFAQLLMVPNNNLITFWLFLAVVVVCGCCSQLPPIVSTNFH